METQTRFDLNTAIASWQQELASEADLTPLVRRELETHLRDTIVELRGRGLNSEESFWLARRRVGRPQQLSEEFSKADPAKVWRERAFWLVLALLIIAVWNASVNSLFLFLMHGLEAFKKILSFIIAVHPLINWLSVLAGVILMAKGRFDLLGKKWAALFNSRLKLVAVVLAVMILNVGVTVWYFKTQPYNRIVSLNLNIVSMVIWPSVFMGLLIWLRPSLNSSEVKPA